MCLFRRWTTRGDIECSEHADVASSRSSSHGTLVLSACGGDDSSSSDTTEAGGGGSGGEGEGGAWAVNTDDCPDDSPNEPIEGTSRSARPCRSRVALPPRRSRPWPRASRTTSTTPTRTSSLPGYTIELTIEDDQFNSNLTTPAVEKLIDETQVDLFTGMIGTANNQAVRDLLNEECYPQLFANTGAPIWGDVENYPWTTGGLPPYNTETAIYVEDIQREFPDGATAAVFHVNSEFGDAYQAAFEELAPDAGIEIVDEQTIENADSNPPTSQVNAIAAEEPDVILAVPLGAQCPTFLTELANAKAANPGWEPRVYITSTCASTLLLAISGAAADGIFTIVTGQGRQRPRQRRGSRRRGVPAGHDRPRASPPTATSPRPAAGWTGGELAVEVLKAAAASEDGLTRASIINAARAHGLPRSRWPGTA